jgi:hypothetical protein
MNIYYNNDIVSLSDNYNYTILGNSLNYLRELGFMEDEIIEKISVNDNYIFRPDRVSFEYYGSDQYYPLILQLNNMRSMFNFVPSEHDNEIRVLPIDKMNILLSILNEENEKTRNKELKNENSN